MRTFHSKVGWWYWAVIILCSCLLFFFFWTHQLLLTLLLALIVIFEIEMLIHTQYVVTAEGVLSIQTGRFLKGASIPVESIVSIEKSHSLESAPALSLSRLQIVYSKGKIKKYVLVSPKNPEDFVKVLSRLNSSIIVNV